MADHLSKRCQYNIDYTNPEHQDLLIAYTYQKLVRYSETHVRYATRMDDEGNDDQWLDLHDKLASPDSDTPLSQLLTEKNTALEQQQPREQHSLGEAWLNVMTRCNNRMTSVAYFLKLSLSHSYKCFNRALCMTEKQYQLPLYTREETVQGPRPWRSYRQYRKPTQLGFEFDEKLPFDT